MGGDLTVILPDGRYRHNDGYVLYVSGGRIVEVSGLTAVYKAKKNKGKGRSKRQTRVKVKKLKVKGTKITFIDEDDGEMTLPGGVYASGGYQVVVVGGGITSVMVDN